MLSWKSHSNYATEPSEDFDDDEKSPNNGDLDLGDVSNDDSEDIIGEDIDFWSIPLQNR